MVGDVQAQDLVLRVQLGRTVPFLAVGRGRVALESGAGHLREEVEERALAGRAVALAFGGGVQDVLRVVLVDQHHQLAARVTRGVEGARLDQRLDHAAVGGGGVHAVHEVVEVLEGAALVALSHDDLGDAFADAADAGETEADTLVRRREVSTGLVDVGGQDGYALAAAGRDVVHNLVRLAHVGGQDRGHVLLGEVGLEPGGLHHEDGVAGGVRLVERVGRELEDVVPQLLRRLALVAVGNRAVHPVVVDGLVGAVALPVEDLAREHLDLFLGYGLAHARVGLARGEAGHLHGDLHDLLLVDHGAVGLLQDRLEAVVVVGDGLLAVHALDVAVDHAGAQGAGAVEGDQSHDLLVLGGLHVFDRAGHAVGLDLEDARGVSRAQQLVDLGVGEVDLVHVDVDAGGTRLDASLNGIGHPVDVRRGGIGVADVGQCLVDDRQGAQAQEVHLEQAHVRDRVALVLGNRDVALGVELGGHVVGDRRRRDQRGARVHALAAGQALDGQRRVDDAVGVGVLVVGVLEVRAVLVGLLLILVQGVGQRELGVVGQHLGELLALVDREAQHAVGVVDGLLGLDSGVGDDLADVVLAVDLADVLQDVLEVLVVEVHVDIGHLGALGREETLKHQAVLERVEVGDVHRVGDDGARSRASARADADAVVLGPLHVILHDQEVVGKALVADDLVLVLEAILDVLAADRKVAPVVAVALGQALLALLAEACLRRLPRPKPREAGQVHLGPVDLVIALGGDLERVVAGLGNPREELAHLGLGLHVKLGALHAHARSVVERRGLADA